MCTKKAVFTTSPTVFWQNAKTFNSRSKKISYHFFSKKLSLVNMFFWTHWVQLSQFRQEFSKRRRNLLAQYLKLLKQKDFFHKQNVFRKNYGIEPQNAVLTTPRNLFPTNGQNAFAQGPKKMKRTEEFPQKTFLLKRFNWTRKLQFSKPRR